MNSFNPLRETPQLGTRVYQAVLDSILGGQIELGSPLRPDVIARLLEVSTTPVREALQRLEGDGLSIKLPNRGWFVREFTPQQIRDLYEFRASLECLGVRLACERMTAEDVERLREMQIVGQEALERQDMDAYRIYNQNFHTAILSAARNSYLLSVMGQIRLQNELLMIKTMRIVGRPLRAIEEHARMIDLLAARAAGPAQELMSDHILGALGDLLRNLTPEHGAPA